MRIAVALLFVLTSCGSDGGDSPATDADPNAPDAAPNAPDADPNAPDADPSCAAWELVNMPVESVASLEAASIHPDRTARFLVTTTQCPGDDLASPTAAPTLENEFMVIVPRVWRRIGTAACSSPDTITRIVSIRFPYSGAWTITGQTPLSVTVNPAPLIACGVTTSGCVLDCDCSGGETCLSGFGFGGPYTQCSVPCEFDRECGGAGSCLVNVADAIGNVCELGSAECSGTKACPDGFDCNSGTCEPNFTLNGSTRHSCSCDAECDAPLRCVFPGGAAQGRCDIACPTLSSQWCQGPHVCDGSGVESDADSVCGWVGD